MLWNLENKQKWSFSISKVVKKVQILENNKNNFHVPKKFPLLSPHIFLNSKWYIKKNKKMVY